MHTIRNLFKPIIFFLSFFSLFANGVTSDYVYDPWEVSQVGEKESLTMFDID